MQTLTNPNPRSGARAKLLAMLIGALIMAAQPAQADNDKHGKKQKTEKILRPDGKFQGKTYSEWEASFWQWLLSYPLDGHPAIDDPSFDFSARQSGKLWYWAAPDGPLTREAPLPEGKAFLLSIRDVDTSTLEEPPFFGADEAAQRENSRFFADHIVNVFCIVDGAPVENIEDYRFSTAQFEFTAPTPWIFGATGGTGTAVGDGYFLLFPSLSKGKHTIHYGGTFHFEPGELADEALDFVKDITIELTVGKGHHHDDDLGEASHPGHD